MTFQEQFQKDLMNIVSSDDFGETGVKYIYVGESLETAEDVSGIFDRESITIDPETGAAVISTAPVFSMPAQQLKREPKVGDKLIIRNEIFVHAKPPHYDGRGMLVCNLHRGKA